MPVFPQEGLTAIVLSYSTVSLGGEFDNGQPEVFDGGNHLHELSEVDGFGDVAVGVEMIGVENVFVGLGGGEDDNRNPPEVGIFFNLGEDFATVFPRKVQVEENEVGARGVGEFAFLAQVGEGFDAIGDPAHIMGNAGFANGFPGEAGIARIVLDEEDLYGSARVHSLKWLQV